MLKRKANATSTRIQESDVQALRCAMCLIREFYVSIRRILLGEVSNAANDLVESKSSPVEELGVPPRFSYVCKQRIRGVYEAVSQVVRMYP
jgi:hypothetical protein